MQSMHLLLRQSLRSSLNLSRTSRLGRSPILPAASKPLHNPRDPRRNFSVCVRCQFRTQHVAFSPSDIGKPSDGKADDKLNDGKATTTIPEGAQDATTSAGISEPPQSAESAHTQEKEEKESRSPNVIDFGGLPSYIENRRSQFSKQFTDMMDQLQSNVFVAGQRLNDLTGYSSIEALKKSIQDQEEQLRAARLRVRTAKDAYAAAINRRSASQREVNELLQRKHAWSPADLERFTHLYRNDHTNEVAENEAQEALSSAERESEEAAAQLTKNILSRYHEEQVWSDKIRRMSTWGTWGLMGMNVILFLIFQIAVEPWRRKRLVKGFEDKVIEAIEKEKTTPPAQTPSVVDSAPAALQETPALVVSEASAPTDETVAIEVTETNTDFPQPATITADEPVTETVNGALESYKLPPFEFPPSSTTAESWRQYLQDLFSERSVILTQRDLSTVAVTSAAAGAAVMGLIFALIRPR